MERAQRRRRLLEASAAAAALALTAWLAFGSALGGGFVWDDWLLIVHNPHLILRPADLLWMARTGYQTAWQPLGWLAWAVLRSAFGPAPGAFHAAALALHAACAAALFAAARRLGERAGATRPALGAFLAALLFCAHPLQAATAAWVTEIPDLAATLLFLAAVWIYLGEEGPARRGVCLALYAGSLLFRWKCVMLPLALLLLDAWPLGRPLTGPRGRRVWLEKLPYAALAAAAGAANAAAKASAGFFFAPSAAALARGLWLYLEKLVWPAALLPEYSLNTSVDFTATPAALAAAFAVLLTAWLWLSRRRRPWALSAWLFYAASVAPPLLAAKAGVHRAYLHYAYAACLPLFALAGFGLARLGTLRGGAVAAALLLAWLPVSRNEAFVWAEGTRLWARALVREPRAISFYDNLADALAREGRFGDAWFFARAAVDRDPRDAAGARILAAVEAAAPGAAHDLPSLWAHLAADELAAGQADEALELAGKALSRRPGLRGAAAVCARAEAAR